MSSSSIKTMIYNLVIASLIFFVTVTILKIETLGILSHWGMAIGVFFGASLLVPQMLKFFTLPRNLITYWIIGILINSGAFYAISLFLPGFTFSETQIDNLDLGVISVNAYVLSPIMTMTLAGIFSSFIQALLSAFKYE